MKAIALANRLCRDLNVQSFVELPVDSRQEILDCINAGIQRLNALSSHESRTTMASFYLAAPSTISIGVTNGSALITGHTFVADDLYRTIRIDGDAIDNQVIAEDELLHPYTGAAGTVSATIYSDAMTVPEPYDELVGTLRIIEKRKDLFPDPRQLETTWKQTRRVGEPQWYRVEANARNQTPPAPSVIRLDSLPGQEYRLEGKFTLAPARVSFGDLLVSGADLPIRAEHVEIYLLPIARGLLSTSDRWKNADTRQTVMQAAEKAEKDYEMRIPRTLATPRNIARTKHGF